MRSTYQEQSVACSRSQLRRCAPSWTRERHVVRSQPLLTTTSLSQETFKGHHEGFKAVGDRFRPIHELSVDLGTNSFMRPES